MTTLAGDAFERGLSRAARRAGGIFHTPWALVERVVAETLAARGGRGPLRILDPACGDGRFLLACANRVPGARLVGVERDDRAAALARAAVAAAEVRVGCALTGDLVEDGAWDVVVGNPPYVRSVTLRREDPALWSALRGRLAATSYREWDLYAAFLDKALDWAAPEGEIGLVVPSRWLTAAFAAPLRARLAAAGAVRRIVDFGADQLFAGATTYTALVFLSRRRATTVAVSRPEGEGAVPAASLGAEPWRLAVGAAARALERLAAAGPPLGRLARIAKGAGSNADPVFLLERRGGGHYSDALAASVEIEAGALVACLRGRDVGPFCASVTRDALLPYDGNRPLGAGELRRRFPQAARYLEACAARLDARERGRFAGERRHLWGRPQNLVWLRDPAAKVVVPDAAARGRAALDRAGTLVIDTAYAIRPLDARLPIGLLLAILNSPVVASWLRATGIPLRGGYFRMKTAYLESLPIADPDTPAARRLAAAVLAGAPAEEVAAAAAALYGTMPAPGVP